MLRPGSSPVSAIVGAKDWPRADIYPCGHLAGNSISRDEVRFYCDAGLEYLRKCPYPCIIRKAPGRCWNVLGKS